MTDTTESWAGIASKVHAGVLLLAALLCDRALAQSEEPTYEDVTVSTQRKTALQAETLSISATPEAAPHLGHPSYIVGFGALVGPAYD